MKQKKKRVTLTRLCEVALNGAFCNGMYGGIRPEEADFEESETDGVAHSAEETERGRKSLFF